MVLAISIHRQQFLSSHPGDTRVTPVPVWRSTWTMPGKNFKVVVRTWIWESSVDVSQMDSRDFKKLLLIEINLQPPWDRKFCKQWHKLPTSTVVGFLPSTLCHFILGFCNITARRSIDDGNPSSLDDVSGGHIDLVGSRPLQWPPKWLRLEFDHLQMWRFFSWKKPLTISKAPRQFMGEGQFQPMV